jgi:hypothetical protein
MTDQEINIKIAEARAQVAALRDVVTLMDKYFKNRGLGYPYPSLIMPQISKVLADTATASRRHDAEVSARTLDEAARAYDVDSESASYLNRLAAEKRREQ